MRTLRTLPILVVLLVFAAAIPAAWGQGLSEMMGTTAAMDTLSGQSVGGGGAGMTALNQLRGAPGPGVAPQAPAAPGQPSFQPVAPGQAPPGQAPLDAAVMPLGDPKSYPALAGRRVYDAVTYRKSESTAIILDDVRKIEITEDQLSEFSDDGMTLGDVEPNDGVYSQILPRSTNEYIGPESAFYLEKVILLMNTTEKMDPLDFFGLTALTTERHSTVPKVRDRIAQQDAKIYSVTQEGKLSGWADTFLKFYRIEMDNPESKFFPLYVPRYPEPPAILPPPVPWKPWAHAMLDSTEPITEGVIGATGTAPTAGPTGTGVYDEDMDSDED